MSQSRTVASTLLVSAALALGACATNHEPAPGGGMVALIDGTETQLAMTSDLSQRLGLQRLTLTGADSRRSISIDVDLDSAALDAAAGSQSIAIATTANFPATSGSAMVTSAIQNVADADQSAIVRGAWVTGGCVACTGSGVEEQQRLSGTLELERVGDTWRGTLFLDVEGQIPFYSTGLSTGASSAATHDASFEASFEVEAATSTEPAPAPNPTPTPHDFEGCGGAPGSR